MSLVKMSSFFPAAVINLVNKIFFLFRICIFNSKIFLLLLVDGQRSGRSFELLYHIKATSQRHLVSLLVVNYYLQRLGPVREKAAEAGLNSAGEDNAS